MNTRRVTGWLGFFGVAAALAWLPEYLSPREDPETVEEAVTPPGKNARSEERRAGKAWRTRGSPSH